MSSADAAVRVTDAGQSFDGRTIYQHVSFAVRHHEVFCILGGSGSGKSTLLRQIIGLSPPHAGRVELLGEDVYAGDGAVLRRVGVMFQSGALFGSMTLLENVMLPLEIHSHLSQEARAEAARVKLGLVGLAHAVDLLPAEISGGMIKRGAIARALALDPPLIFMDEPSAGLDPSTSAGLDRLILELRDELGTTFVVVTHELGSIMAIADRCIMLDREAQGIIAEGDPHKLAETSENPIVRRFFRREAA